MAAFFSPHFRDHLSGLTLAEVVPWRRVVLRIRSTFFPPVLPEQFDGVLSADGPIPAAHIIRGAVFVTAPANAFGMFRAKRKLSHA